MLPSTRDPVARVSNMLGVIASDSILEPEEIEQSEDDEEIFFLL